MGVGQPESEWHPERAIHEDRTKGDGRSEFDRDRDRVLHSTRFRRLGSKTQILRTSAPGDFRNRLTHTLEVAQLGRTLARGHGVPEALVEAACLAHDMGHPPFGHAGERLLAGKMAPYGGFDANAQTLRILLRLERRGSGESLNLTRGTYWSVLKYPYRRVGGNAKPDHERELKSAGVNRVNDAWVAGTRFLYEDDLAWPVGPDKQPFGEWLAQGTDDERLAIHDPVARITEEPPRSLPCQIMDWCDDAAYVVHDFEDAVATGLIFPGSTERHGEQVAQTVLKEFDGRVSSEAAGRQGELERLVHAALEDVEGIVSKAYAKVEPVQELRRHTRGWLSDFMTRTEVDHAKRRVLVPLELRARVAVLKHLERECVIRDREVVMHLRKGTLMMARLFDELMDDPKIVDDRFGQLLPRVEQEQFAAAAQADDEPSRARIVCDYIASLSDIGLVAVYQSVFDSRGTGA